MKLRIFRPPAFYATFEYGRSELKSIRKAGMKYIEAPLPELYHLAADPEEITNLHNPAEEYTAYFYLGVIALKRNDEEEARKRFDRVLQLNPTYYPVFNALGSWLKNKGRSEEAKEEFRKALSLNPEDQIAIQGLKSIR